MSLVKIVKHKPSETSEHSECLKSFLGDNRYVKMCLKEETRLGKHDMMKNLIIGYHL